MQLGNRERNCRCNYFRKRYTQILDRTLRAYFAALYAKYGDSNALIHIHN